MTNKMREVVGKCVKLCGFMQPSVAYPELVSRVVSKSRKFKWLVKVGACKDVNPLIKKIMAGGGVSGQPENPPGYATDHRHHWAAVVSCGLAKISACRLKVSLFRPVLC